MLKFVGRGEAMEWEILMTSQVEGFLDELYETDKEAIA